MSCQQGVYPNCTLPPELLDNITEYLDYDKDTLFSLALVSKSWSPLAQSRLFDRIRIRPSLQHEICGRVLACNATACHIRHVAFIFTEDLKGDGLEEVVERMKNSSVLKSLTISFYRPNFNPHRRFFDSLSTSGSFSGIVELHVAFKGDILQDMIRFVCSFPQLKTLGGNFCPATLSKDPQTDSGSIVACVLPVSLEALHLNAPYQLKALDYLEKWLALHHPRGVSEFSVYMNRIRKFQPYATPFCSGNLKILTLGLRFGYSQELETRDFDCSPFQQLESIEVDWSVIALHFHLIHNMLGTISSSRFQRFRVIDTPSLPRPSIGLQQDFKVLDELFASDRFIGVALEFYLDNVKPGTLVRRQEEVRQLFGKCIMQRRLKIAPSWERKPGHSVWSRWNTFERNITISSFGSSY